jgi:hypothetical protein
MEDALFSLNAKPLVIGHESLASFTQTSTNRPVIIKVYRDYLLGSNDADFNGNYAQLLLIQGNKEKAEQYLKIAFKDSNNPKDLDLELWFYRLAHYPKYRDEAIIQLDNLLKQGGKSIGWNFSENIKQAKKEGFEPISLLEDYSDRITKE